VTLLALTRGDVADYVNTLVLVYVVLIVIRIVVSYFPRIPYNRWLNMFLTFVTDVTDPYLNVFRRFVPPLRIGPGALDLSPTIGIVLLLVLGPIVASLIRG
jgi:YggT family protein